MPASKRFHVALGRHVGIFITIITLLAASSCATVVTPDDAARLEQTANLISDVKKFGRTLGIEPTEALSRTVRESPPLSMLWLWMQREGTLAVNTPVDIRMAIGYSAEKERLRIEQVYRVEGYSVYYRQGNEFSDPRSIATVGFAEEAIVRRVKVILHEDLHGDPNFALPWDIEEGIVTPLGSLAAIEYFRWKGDDTNLQNTLTSVNEERETAKELTAFSTEAQKIFAQESPDAAKEKALAMLGNFPLYQKQFERQTRGQHAPTALEAKVSHDLAYYRYYDSIAALAELAPSLSALIGDLKGIPVTATHALVDDFLRNLQNKYSAGKS
jgi:hypothetical protein